MGKAQPDSGRHAYLGFLEGVEQRVALQLCASPCVWLNVACLVAYWDGDMLVG